MPLVFPISNSFMVKKWIEIQRRKTCGPYTVSQITTLSLLSLWRNCVHGYVKPYLFTFCFSKPMPENLTASNAVGWKYNKRAKHTKRKRKITFNTTQITTSTPLLPNNNNRGAHKFLYLTFSSYHNLLQTSAHCYKYLRENRRQKKLINTVAKKLSICGFYSCVFAFMIQNQRSCKKPKKTSSFFAWS